MTERGGNFSGATITQDLGATGFVTIPAIGATRLNTPVRALIVITAGNLAVELDDGTDNSASVIPVTASPTPIQLGAVRFAPNNTAVCIGLR